MKRLIILPKSIIIIWGIYLLMIFPLLADEKSDHYPGNFFSNEEIEVIAREGCPKSSTTELCAKGIIKRAKQGFSVYTAIFTGCSMRKTELANYCFYNSLKAFGKAFIKIGKKNVAKKLSNEVYKPCNAKEGTSYKIVVKEY